jgi:hypothetical protein
MGGPTTTPTTPPPPPTTTVPGLTPGASYDCYAIAKNWDGNVVCATKGEVTMNTDSGKPIITSTTCPASVDATAAAISSVATMTASPATSVDVAWTAGVVSSPAATGTETFYVGFVASTAVCPTDVTFDVARPGSGSGSVTTTVGGLTPSTSYVCVYTHMMDDLMINDLMINDLMINDLMINDLMMDGQMTLKKREEGPKSDIRTRMILMILAHLICSPCGISWADSGHCFC